MEFVAKKKKISFKMDGASIELRCPTIADQEMLNDKLSSCEPKDAIKVYIDWFSGLGLSPDISRQLDSSTFFDLVKFILNPEEDKKKQTP